MAYVLRAQTRNRLLCRVFGGSAAGRFGEFLGASTSPLPAHGIEGRMTSDCYKPGPQASQPWIELRRVLPELEKGPLRDLRGRFHVGAHLYRDVHHGPRVPLVRQLKRLFVTARNAAQQHGVVGTAEHTKTFQGRFTGPLYGRKGAHTGFNAPRPGTDH